MQVFCKKMLILANQEVLCTKEEPLKSPPRLGLNAGHHPWVVWKYFHVNLPKTASNGNLIIFLSHRKVSDLHLVPQDFYKKTNFI